MNADDSVCKQPGKGNYFRLNRLKTAHFHLMSSGA